MKIGDALLDQAAGCLRERGMIVEKICRQQTVEIPVFAHILPVVVLGLEYHATKEAERFAACVLVHHNSESGYPVNADWLQKLCWNIAVQNVAPTGSPGVSIESKGTARFADHSQLRHPLAVILSQYDLRWMSDGPLFLALLEVRSE